MIRFFATALSILFAATGPAAAEGPDALLAALEGRWRAEGTVQGETVAYNAEGRFTLGGAFLRFDMIEAAETPTYEANIYLAHSPKGDYVAHWMDVFGADGARVVGEGANESGRLVILFPYSNATFRDVFDFAEDGKSFTLVVDSDDGLSGWQVFADYVFTRVED